MLPNSSSSELGKFPIGPIHCSPHTIRDLMAELRSLLLDKHAFPRTVLCVNSHIYNLAWEDETLRQYLNCSRVITADGMAIVWAARFLGNKISERCNMTEAYHAFLASDQMPPSKAILIGCSQDEAESAALRASQSAHCKVAAAYSGYLKNEEYEAIFLRHTEIDFVFLGMGTPRTEHLTQLAARCCSKAVVWGIGGGTVRIEAGTMTEAPAIWRRTGLQWLHRLVSDPGNLWRRYLLGNPLFVWRILRLAVARKIR